MLAIVCLRYPVCHQLCVYGVLCVTSGVFEVSSVLPVAYLRSSTVFSVFDMSSTIVCLAVPMAQWLRALFHYHV